MTDKEVLLMAYGALRGVSTKYDSIDKMLLEIIEGHLFPKSIVPPAPIGVTEIEFLPS